ncbi:SDR family oxidoreductase [bacterium]|nr:SDR family oxidoreductase [bacterium]
MTPSWALVTGSSSGIGVCFAWELAQKGYSLVLVARRRERMLELAAQISKKYLVSVEVIACDLSESSAIPLIVAELNNKKIEIEVLVNNAGYGKLESFLTSDKAINTNMIDLNIKALTDLTHALAKPMVQNKKGFILMVASVGAFQPDPYFAVYGATKAYVLSFGEALYHELKPYGVTVSTFAPGPTATEFLDTANVPKSPLTLKFLVPANTVAAIGLKGLFKKQRLIVPGFSNKIMVFLVQLLPRAIVLAMAALTAKMMMGKNNT